MSNEILTFLKSTASNYEFQLSLFSSILSTFLWIKGKFFKRVDLDFAYYLYPNDSKTTTFVFVYSHVTLKKLDLFKNDLFGFSVPKNVRIIKAEILDFNKDLISQLNLIKNTHKVPINFHHINKGGYFVVKLVHSKCDISDIEFKTQIAGVSSCLRVYPELFEYKWGTIFSILSFLNLYTIILVFTSNNKNNIWIDIIAIIFYFLCFVINLRLSISMLYDIFMWKHVFNKFIKVKK